MILSLTQAAHILEVTRQAVYVAITRKKLEAYKIGNFWKIEAESVKRYQETKYARIAQPEGIYTVNEAAKKLKVPTQHIYYACRRKYLIPHNATLPVLFSDASLEEYKTKFKIKHRKRNKRQKSWRICVDDVYKKVS